MPEDILPDSGGWKFTWKKGHTEKRVISSGADSILEVGANYLQIVTVVAGYLNYEVIDQVPINNVRGPHKNYPLVI